jgi:hypothetical protein
MFAVAAHAGEREAHAREGESRVAARLRAIQHAYQAAAGHDTAVTSREPTRPSRHARPVVGKELELE